MRVYRSKIVKITNFLRIQSVLIFDSFATVLIMTSTWLYLAAILVVAYVGKAKSQAYTVKTPEITALSPSGVKFSYKKDDAGLSLVAFHFNVNKVLNGVESSTYAQDITTTTEGAFVYMEPLATVAKGDKIYYWIYCLVNGVGYTLTDQVWTYNGEETTTVMTTTTTETTTRTTTTKTPYTGPTTTPPDCSACPCNSFQGDEDDERIKVTCTTYPCLIFEDNFDYLNLNTWEHEITAGGGGNWEFQYYHNNRTNSYVKDGKLHLKPTLTEEKYGTNSVTSAGTVLELWGSEPANLCTGNQWYGCRRETQGSNIVNPIQSARIRTVNSFSFRYGRIEVKAKMPRGDWIWPAIWLLPRFQAYGGWPASGEIDILESRGNEEYYSSDGTHIGVQQIGSTLHYGPYWPENGWPFAHGAKNLEGSTFADDFHLFRLDWDRDGMKFFVDDEEFLHVPTDEGYWRKGKFDDHLPDENNAWRYSSSTDAPFDQEFYIILNVAVGGTGGYFDDANQNSIPKPWTDSSPQAALDFWLARAQWYPTWAEGDDRAMAIDHIRVWKMTEEQDTM